MILYCPLNRFVTVCFNRCNFIDILNIILHNTEISFKDYFNSNES